MAVLFNLLMEVSLTTASNILYLIVCHYEPNE